MIHVVYGINDNYSKFAATSILSLFENTAENVTVHILHDNTLTQDNCEKFICTAKNYNQQVKFYNVEKIYTDEVLEFKNKFPEIFIQRFSVVAAFRLLLPKIMPSSMDKIIYLDADTVVNLDINELWRVELANKPLAAVTDHGAITCPLCIDGVVKVEDYFNSGVMLINLNKWRDDAEFLTGGGRIYC